MEANTAELEKVQVHIDLVKEAIAMGEQLELLNKMPEFQEIVIKGFMEDEPARLAAIITDPNLQEATDQANILSSIKAVGHLGDYFRNIEKRKLQLVDTLAKAEEYQVELRNLPEED